MGGGISYCFKLTYNGFIIGGSVCGALRQSKAYIKYGKTIEIRRLALIETGCNFESYFLGKIIWWLKKNTDIDMVISYSDLSVGHKGTIYKASNFKKIGETAPSIHIFWKGARYHPRSLTIERPYSYELREAIKNGDAVKEIGKSKIIWGYKISRNP